MITLELHLVSTLKSSDKGDIQLVAGDKGKLYIRRYRSISPELFQRIKGISSPLVERLVERSEDAHGSYFVSEYIEGVPACDRQFTRKEAVRALLELCDAIHAVHRAGIVHRDIKPANIICTGDGHIRLIDFDCARLRVQYQSRDTQLLGTKGYAPPEQYGFMQTDPRSDIYAFGVTMREILGDEADRPGFRRIIGRCTQFDPERRYSNIRTVRRALRLAELPWLVPAAVAAAAFAACLLLLLRTPQQPAPPGLVRLTYTSESDSTSESAPPTAESAEERAEPEHTEESSSDSTQLSEPEPKPTQENLPTSEPEQTTIPEPPAPPTENTRVPEHSTTPQSEEPAPAVNEGPAQTTAVISPGTDEAQTSPAAEDTPKIPFTTVTDDDGLYHDEFDYVFYDDPEVHGHWTAFKEISGDSDVDHITGNDIFRAEYADLDIYKQKLDVYENGTLAFYRPQPESIEPTNLWTNGYYISSPEEGGLVCRMFTVTIGSGKKYLLLEQRPVGESDGSPHRFIVYFKENSDQ